MPTIVEDAEVPEGVTLYDPEDFDTQRQLLFDTAKDTIAKQFPKSYNGVRMDLSDLDYIDPETFSIAEQKKALHTDAYLARRLRGTVTLTDEKTGNVLDKKKITLMRVPYLTDRGTFIREGNEWTTLMQSRLLPGAYTREQANGDLETQFNVRPGTGNAFRIGFSPASSQYRLIMKGSNLHLYSLLKDIGVSDETLVDKWGPEILQTNQDKYDSRTLDKAYTKIVPEWERSKKADISREEKAAAVRKALDTSQVSTAVLKRTLPNLFNMKKSATWKSLASTMEKVASFSKSDLQGLAAYINAVSGSTIDTELDKNSLEAAIKQQIGLVGDAADTPGADAVKQMQMQGALKAVQKKVKDVYDFN